MKYLFFLSLIILPLVSCKKKEPDYNDMLRSIQNKKWVLTYGKGTDSSGNIIVDSVLGRPSYSRDDYMIWYPNNTFKVFDNMELNPYPDFPPPLVDSGVYVLDGKMIVAQTEIGGTTYLNSDFEYVTNDEVCFTPHYKGHGSFFFYYRRID